MRQQSLDALKLLRRATLELRDRIAHADEAIDRFAERLETYNKGEKE